MNKEVSTNNRQDKKGDGEGGNASHQKFKVSIFPFHLEQKFFHSSSLRILISYAQEFLRIHKLRSKENIALF